MRIWRCWYPRLHIIPLEVEVAKVEPRTTARRTAAFFSSGVDAWFTLLSHQNESHTTQIDDLLTVWGLDIRVDRPREFDKLREVLGRVTSKYQLAGVEVATNFYREGTFWRARADWGQVGHGCALASIGLLFQNRYCRVLIPSTHRYDDLIPWGSHPLTDPLLSTSATRFVHDGAGFSRTEKTAFVINSQLALDNLQVCWGTGSFHNCGTCDKCYRTMTTLLLLGALDRCGTFEGKGVDLGRRFPLRQRYFADRSNMSPTLCVCRIPQSFSTQIGISSLVHDSRDRKSTLL